MALFINESQVCESFSAAEAFAAVKQAHLDLASGAADNAVRIRSRAKHMSLHSMSAASDAIGLAAAKVYSATKHGVRSLVLLFSSETGEHLAAIEANQLGRRRTAAASAVAASVLYKNDRARIGIIGAGFQGRGLLEAFVDDSFPAKITECSIFSRKDASRSEFCKQTAQVFDKVKNCSSAEEAAANCDILLLATTSSAPVVDLDWLKNVSCICALGSNALSRRELPPRALSGASLVVVDSLDTAKAEAGDLLSPIENGKLRWSDILELGELLSADPNINTSSYRVFCSQGLAIQDLYCAATIYRKHCA